MPDFKPTQSHVTAARAALHAHDYGNITLSEAQYSACLIVISAYCQTAEVARVVWDHAQTTILRHRYRG